MPTCFVVQGFGKKTDFESGRMLDLDASYDVIKEAVQAAGYDCIRADETNRTGHIEQVMYQQLLNADLVIADLSTSNVNAFYELGVRFALRPYTTIVVAENRITFPFDINHVFIRTYEHLGTDIGRQEAKRFITELTALIQNISVDEPATDSPVYTFIPTLHALPAGQPIFGAPTSVAGEGAQESLASLKQRARDAMEASDFTTAIRLWTEARDQGPKDDHVVQQLALATYKSRQPTELQALRDARQTLEYLWPRDSLDPETLGLWAAVHKRLHDLDGNPADLDEAITATEKGFILRNDYYNGINLAFLLDLRARQSQPELAREDHARARSTRRRVMDICKDKLEGLEHGSEERYWIIATLEEAAMGIGDNESAEHWHTRALETQPATWKLETTAQQAERLRELLAQVTGHIDT